MGKVIVVISLCFIIAMCLSKFEILKANDIEEIEKTVETWITDPIVNIYNDLRSTEQIIKDADIVEYEEQTEITTCATAESKQSYEQNVETTCTEHHTDYSKSYTETYNNIYSDDRDYANYYGRLHIPSVGIDVALYFECSQSVVDREDSAFIFPRDGYDGLIVGDHNNQGFNKLFNVSVGTTGYIELSDGSVVNIKCTWSGYGHNTVQDITDLDYNPITNGYDYLIYTCYDGWQNIGVWKWSQY